MRRVLFIVEAFGGGVFTYISELSNKLSSNYEIYIAYSTRKQTPENYREYFDSKIKLIEVKSFTRELNVKKDVKALFELKKIVREVDPDIIHFHSSKAGVLGRLGFSGKKRKKFYTPHGYSFFMPNISSEKKLFYKCIEKLCSYSKCVTIACSKSEYEATLNLTSKAEYVNNGINIDNLKQYAPTKNPQKNKGTLRIAILGRIEFQKNPQLFNKIASGYPNDEFIWIGDGNLRSMLTAPNIKITGWLSRDDALKMMQDADVFILTSRFEGLPMSLLEAMYMKKVCIVSNVTGNRDVINKNNGFICDNIDEYFKAIDTIKHSDTSSLVDNAYGDIVTEYNTDHMARKYIDIYEKYI